MNAKVLIITLAALGVGLGGGYLIGETKAKKVEPVEVAEAPPVAKTAQNAKKEYFIKQRNELIEGLAKISKLKPSDEHAEEAHAALDFKSFDDVRVKAVKDQARELVGEMFAVLDVRKAELAKESPSKDELRALDYRFKEELQGVSPTLIQLAKEVSLLDYREE